MNDLSELFSGLVLRALICKRCKAVLPVAFDEEDGMKRLKAKHIKPWMRGYSATHEAWSGTDQVAI